MESERRPQIILCIGFLLLTISSRSPAQTVDRSEVHHRNQCRLAAQVLESGHPANKGAWARGFISSCGEQGPAFLAAQWERVGNDSAEVEYLERTSKRLRDARLYQRLRVTALDPARPDIVRVGAMLVLAKYVDPHNAMWFSDLRAPGGPNPRIRTVTSWSTGGVQVIGSSPLNGSVAQPVLALLEQIAAARTTERLPVWYAAAVLAKRVKFDIEAGRAR